MTVQLEKSRKEEFLGNGSQTVFSLSVTFVQWDRISREVIGSSQVQLLDVQKYRGIAHGRVSSLMKSEL